MARWLSGSPACTGARYAARTACRTSLGGPPPLLVLLASVPVLVHVPGSFLAVPGHDGGRCQVAGVRAVRRVVLAGAGVLPVPAAS